MNKTTVYFDGLCHLCSREINHYRKMRGSEKIRFVDITATDFDARIEGVDPVLVHKVIHVKNPEGKLFLGPDAFICIWSELPALYFLVPIARNPVVHKMLEILYKGFAIVRPLLPRKSCEASPYCELKPRS